MLFWYLAVILILDCFSAYIQIRHDSSIRQLPTTQATSTCNFSVVLSRLDYCNSLLSCCPQYLLDKLQKVQKQGLGVKLRNLTRSTDQTLHWLPVTLCIQYKFISASTPSVAHPLSICPSSFNLTLQQSSYDPHPTHEPFSPLVYPSCKHKNIW